MEYNVQYLSSIGTPTQTGLSFTLTLTTAQLRELVVDQSVSDFLVYVYVAESMPTGLGVSREIWNSGSPVANVSEQNISITGLSKNTRYVVTVNEINYGAGIRRCFKTSGTFSNAEQNLNADGTLNFPASRGSRHGCFAVTRTPQDFKECMCWGTRGGARFNTTTATRMALGCQDSS